MYCMADCCFCTCLTSAANSIAWAGAVLTAYILNRRLVFHSRNKIWKELPSFAALRFLTLLVENVLLWLLIDHLYILPLPAKLLVSVITVVGNYVFCKYGVFKKEEICHDKNQYYRTLL